MELAHELLRLALVVGVVAQAADVPRGVVTAFLPPGHSNAAVAGLEPPVVVNGTAYGFISTRNVEVAARRPSCLRDLRIGVALATRRLAFVDVEPSTGPSLLMANLENCSLPDGTWTSWPYDDIDADATSHVLQTETYRRASFADVGAVVSSAVVLGGLRAHNFNADEVAITQFGIVIAGALQAATVQIDNIVAEEYKPPSIQDDDDPPVPVLDDDYDEGLTTTIRFDVAIHYWPVGATVLETPEAIAQALKTAISDGSLQSNLDSYAGPQFCPSCVLRDATVNVELSYVKIDELTMDEPHAVAAPCTANCA